MQAIRPPADPATETQRQVARQLEVAAETAAEQAKTARLNALAILAKTYSDSLEWMGTQPGDKSAAIVQVSQLHQWAVSQVEQLSGLGAERGLYFEKTSGSPGEAE